MAAKKAKGASFSKSGTKAGTAAYNAANKVRIAKETLASKKKEIKKTEKDISRNIKNQRAAQDMGLKSQEKYYGKNIKYYALEKLPKVKAERGMASQNLSDRTRTATRTAAIAKRVSKKTK